MESIKCDTSTQCWGIHSKEYSSHVYYVDIIHLFLLNNIIKIKIIILVYSENSINKSIPQFSKCLSINRTCETFSYK